MKQVHKKSTDEAVNQMLLSAYKRHIDLAWDRAETQQPQCGFGRLLLCCNDCYAGPCRINPFGAEDQRTICGRDRNTLTANGLLNKVADGSLALLKLAREFGADVAAEELADAVTAGDELIIEQNFTERLEDLGQRAANALAAIHKVKDSVYGKTLAKTTAVNLGTLDAQAVNIVVHGHVAPQVIRGLAEAARQSSISVKLSAACGADAGGTVTLPVLTNYDSQETILLTGAADLLVVGNQCVMPAMIALAQKENVPVVRSSSLRDQAALDAALQTARDAFHRRAGKITAIPPQTQPLYTGCGTAEGKLNEALKTGFARGSVKGLVYLGGCGTIDHSQDAMPVQLAKQLLQDGYIVVTSGCAGMSLAKAGMTDPDFANGNPVLKAALPDGLPAVLYIGACHDAARFVAMADALKDSGMPVFAVLPEVTHHKTLATAAAFAASGITAFVGLEQIFAEAAVKDLLSSATTGRARILPLGDLDNVPRAWAEAAAGR
jgi:hydroxylamine reductase (hybrid-cluster protein)